jgi:hypothetical protein
MPRYVVADVSGDPKAPALVGASEKLRAKILELGCEPVGYLGSWDASIDFGMVVEVFRHPSEPVIVATYDQSPFGEGFALSTMLDDGTVVSTDRFPKRWKLFALMIRVIPLHPASERFFSYVHAGSPARILAKHIEHVKERTSGDAKPVVAPPLVLYAAIRLRSRELRLPRPQQVRRLHRRASLAVFLAMVAPFVAWVLVEHGVRGLRAAVGPATLIAAIVAYFVASFVTMRIGILFMRAKDGSAPVPPERLLARAREMRACDFAAIVPARSRR